MKLSLIQSAKTSVKSHDNDSGRDKFKGNLHLGIRPVQTFCSLIFSEPDYSVTGNPFHRKQPVLLSDVNNTFYPHSLTDLPNSRFTLRK